jgi:hypothetical protein
MRQSLRLVIMLLGWAAFRPPTALAQTCATAPVNLNYRVSNTTNTYISGDWRNRPSAGVPDVSSFTQASTVYTSTDANSTFATGTLNGQTLTWSTTYSSATNATTGSTVTYNFSRPVANLTVRVQDIDAIFNAGTPGIGGLLGTPSSGYTDEVRFTGSTGANGTGTAVTPVLTRANTSTKYVTTVGNIATGIVADGNNTTTDDATVIATYPAAVTSITLRYRNTTAASTFSNQSVGIDNISWCRITPTAAPVTTTTVSSSATQAAIRSLSGTADGTLGYEVTSLPTNGTLFYNTTGTTYAPVVINQTLTVAQATSLRYTPNPGFTGTSTTFSYRAKDDANLTSATVTYTIPLQSVASCGTTTNSIAFGTLTAGEDWRTHAPLAVPAGSSTTISSGGYTTSANTASTLQIGAVNSNTLAWNNDYSGATRTSSVTFTFSRAVSNFTVQVQDIDAATGSFVDVVTFAGANGATGVTPFLSVANPNSGIVTVSGATATGQTATTSPVDGTVTAYFPSAITTLTITYANGVSSTVTDPGSQFIGIDNMSWCRLAPVANNVTTPTVLSTATQAGISSLSGSTPDGGTIASYVITSLPANGTLLYNTPGGNWAPVTVNQTLTPAQAALLRYSANQSFTGTSTTFGYRVIDEAGASSNIATYTIPLQYVAPCGTATNTFAFSSRPANEDWKAHAPLPVSAGASTAISSGGYTTSANTTSVLQIATVNTLTTLGWNNDYSGAARTSSVTFTFSRPVSNFTTRVVDIDGAAGSFIDVVTFAGANGGTSVTPTLAADNPSAGVVTINGATATGQTATESPIDGTVTASFPSAITTLTITYANGVPSTVTDPGNQVIGIENMSWCRLAPVATDVTTASLSNGGGQQTISSLSGSAPDGTIQSYTIGALPQASQGVLYVNGVLLNTTNFPGLVLTPAQAAELTFAPAAAFVGSATFSYLATDNANVVSNSATYTIPVTATPPPAACASPGKDPSTFSAVPNTYYPGVGTAAATTNQLSLGTLRNGGNTTPIAANDLLLVIQMQGATINTSNTASYGSTTSVTAGQYEYVTVSSVSGTTVTLSSALKNTYVTSSTASGTTATLRTFQIVRIPQYSNLTLTANVAPPAWDGSTGGIVALDVAGTLNFGGRTINASGLGFRGGAGRLLTTNTDATSYLTTAASNNNAQKGEGIAGTPQYVNYNGAIQNTGVDGYPGGSSGRGAPGNAGGGGDDNAFNSGGGGGANGGAGGRGGNTYKNNTLNGGEPGAAFAAQPNRLVLGGGGGAGTTNEGTGTLSNGFASSGAAGGGLVIVRAGSVSGTGSIIADGAAADNTARNDGAGGGGAGGSILVTASVPSGLSNLTLSAKGSAGGNNRPATNGGTQHGPGGGGGGGVILTNGPVAVASSAIGGVSGQTTYSTTDGTAVPEGTTTGTGTVPYGAVAGTTGSSTSNTSTTIANSTAGANCVADVSTTITGPTTLSAGQPTSPFTVTFANNGTGPAASVTQRVTLPTGAALTAAQRATIVAAYPSVTFSTTGTGVNAITVIDFGTLVQVASGASFSYSFAYTAPITPTTTNSIATTSNTTTSTPELGLTANNAATTTSTVGAAADVTVTLSGPTTLNAGQPTGTFTATFINQGPSSAANVARIVTLPNGATVSTAQQKAITDIYPSASFATPGTIDFGSINSLPSDASNVVRFAFTAPTATGSSTLGGSTSTTTSQGANNAPDTSFLTLNTVATADVVAAITTSATATTGTFQVTFSNNGPQTAAGIVRTVQLPAGLTNVTLSDRDASYDPTTGLVSYAASPNIATGSSLATTITYNLASSTTPAAATASVSTTTNEAGLTANNTKTAVMPAQFDLATTLTGPTTTSAGSPTTLYVTTTNNGPNSAPVASQTISIPSDTPLTNVYITNGGLYVYNTTTKIGTVTFPPVADLPSGVTVANSVSFSAPSADFAPSALVAPTTGDTNTANNTAYLNGSTTSTASVAVTATTLAKTNEATTITADATIVSAGTVVTYTVQSFNRGFLNTTSVNNVAERVQLIPGLSASTLTVGGATGTLLNDILTFVTSNGTTTYNTTTGLLIYPVLATQASGSSFTYDLLAVTVPANVGNNGQLLATASVSTANSDPVPSDNTSSVVVKVLTPSDLSSTITGPVTISAGQTATYTATYINRGPGSATSVVETAQLPAGLDNVLVQYASGNVIANAYNKVTGLVTFPTIDNAPAGSSQVYNISLTAPAQSFSVSSFVSSGTTDNATTNNTALLRTVVNPTADVAVYVSGPATAVAGNAVTYAVTTVNNGTAAASAVQGTLQLPSGLTGFTSTGGGTYDATTGLVTFPSQLLAAGESRVGVVTFTMPTNLANGQLSSTASVSTTSTDLVAGNNTSAITTAVAPATPDVADLAVSITPPVSPAVAGTAISYTLTFQNTSTTTAAVKVIPTAYLAAGLQNVIVRDANNVVIPNAYNSTTGQVVLPTIDSQAAGNQTTYTVSLLAPTTALAISASAVSSNTSDPNPANNVAGSEIAITPLYDVVTSLTGPASAQPGSVNTYSVTTTNNGPSTSSATAGSTTQTVRVPVGAQVGGLPTGASYDSSTGLITFPAISSQAAGTNGAVTNTFMVVMPATGTLDLTATVAAAGESTTGNNVFTLSTEQANQAPIAQNVWNTLQSARGNTATILPLSPLNATDADGTISRYTVLSLPNNMQGILYLSDGSPVLAGQTVPANGLYFAPTPGYAGNATFTYRATDNNLSISNTALYTIPVAQDQSSAYTTYNTTKGNSNPYVTGDVLAQTADPNAATYNSSGVIYNTTGELQSGAANGIASAVISSGTLPTGVTLDVATGRIYVSNANLLPRVTQTTSYTVQVITTDANGGISTVPVTLVIGANPIPLPVTLIEFTAQAANRDAQLRWTTASEKHNDHFEIERSFDGTSFTKIGQVAGHGTTSAASVYTLTDAGVAAQATGPVYYRLRQVDLDGTATYSPVRTVSFTATTASLSLYPNPVADRTTLDLSQLASTELQVQLLDATGRAVRTWTLSGGQQHTLDLSTLASGSYLLLVTGTQPSNTAVRQTLRLTKE